MMRDFQPTLLLLCVAAPLVALGCVCPPCAAGAGPAGAGATPAAANPGGESTAALAGDGMIWNGEGVGNAAKGWASCDKQPCKSELTAVPGVGKDGTTGLKFVGEGAGFVGVGWNWFGWYPENAGTDVSGHSKLTFWIRFELPSPELAPEPSAVTFSIGGSNKKNSASAPLSDYDKSAMDGKWHKISVPLADLKKGDGKDLDLKSVWEFRIGTWSAAPRKFEIYVDDIGFEK